RIPEATFRLTGTPTVVWRLLVISPRKAKICRAAPLFVGLAPDRSVGSQLVRFGAILNRNRIGRRSRRSWAMKLQKFSAVLALAEKHHGARGVKARLAEEMSGDLADLNQSDDRFLAAMTRAVFSSGFSWEVVEQKWPGFEAAFEGFDPHRVAFY